MAIQYYMRGYNTSSPGTVGYVDWVVNDTPDSTATYVPAPYVSGNITNITVNKTVQSKTDNFLESDQGYILSDGLFFHVNAHDWLHASPPSITVIPPPTSYTGFAVTRGGTTNAAGQLVAGASTNFFSCLIWDEANQRWRFVRNTNGDHVTLGATQDVSMGNIISDGYLRIDGYIAIGPAPALTTGSLRLTNNLWITSRKAAGAADGYLIRLDNTDRVQIGTLADNPVTYIPGNLRVDGYVRDGSTNVPTTGFVRNGNNTSIITARDQQNANDHILLSTNNVTQNNNLVLGNATANFGNILLNTVTAGLHQFQTNTTTFLELGTSGTPANNNPNNFVRFTSAIVNPSIYQVTAAAGSGQLMNVQSQSTTAAGQTGGSVALTAGSAPVGGFGGTIDLYAGATGSFPVAATLKMRIHPTTAPTAANNNSIQYFENLFRVDTAQTAPLFRQDDNTTSSATGQPYTVQAQNATGATSTGGALNLTSGTGTTVAGNVNIQTGGTNQIIVSPTFITPGTITPTAGSVVIRGSLEVVGTTTTIDSTVVDIIGRVIHANWTDPVQSPNTAVPSLVAGYTVHRGNIAGVPRDGAALIWSEGTLPSGGDGYWRAITTPGDGYGNDNTNVTNTTTGLGVMASNFAPTLDPIPVAGTLPASGGLRVANNTFASVARNVAPVTTIAAASNLTTLPQATINVASTTGFTAAGTLLIFSDAGVQTVTYTGTSGGNQFTGATGGTGLIHTGAYVAQTNKSTTIAAGSNGATLPQATINVASTVGFPASGTIRVISNGNNGGTQTITYTGTGATTFTGCSGGTGTLATGNSVTSLAIPGNADIQLIGTDFGNRVLHGNPTTGNGHIFNTPTATTYNFQVNSIDQVVFGATDTNADGYIESISLGPTVNIPRISQTTRPDTGANAGFALVLQAQAGQQQSGGNANNNGGNLILASGPAGTGGGGAPAVHGTVDIQTDGNIKIRVFPTFAASAADNNSMLIDESLIRVGPAQNVPRIRQDNTTNASGQSFSLQAQNAATTGGPLLLQGGTGATNDGYVNIITGTTTKMTVFPTTAVSAADNNSILFFENLFRIDTAQVTPRLRQDDKTTNAATGETFTIQAQNETGTTSTGGNLVLTSGTGTTVAGNVNIQTGGLTRVSVNPTFTTFNDTAEAYRVTPVSAGTTTLQFASTVTAARIFQADLTTNSGTGAPLTVQAQNETGTTSVGGALNLTSGTGTTTNGAVNLQVAGVTTASLVTNKFVFNKGRRRNVTSISSAGGPYTTLATDDYIAVTLLAAPLTVNLPTTPVLGDEYVIKDTTGNAATSNVTVSGNGNNIDGAASFTLSQPYAAATFTFAGGQWSVS